MTRDIVSKGLHSETWYILAGSPLVPALDPGPFPSPVSFLGLHSASDLKLKAEEAWDKSILSWLKSFIVLCVCVCVCLVQIRNNYCS